MGYYDDAAQILFDSSRVASLLQGSDFGFDVGNWLISKLYVYVARCVLAAAPVSIAIRARDAN